MNVCNNVSVRVSVTSEVYARKIEFIFLSTWKQMNDDENLNIQYNTFNLNIKLNLIKYLIKILSF